MSGAKSNSKGKAWERQVARDLQETWPEARKGYQYRASDKQGDVVGTPFSIECKHHKAQPNITNALKQADKVPGVPVAITKKTYDKPVASMYYHQWLEMVHLLYFLLGEKEQ